MAAASIPNGPRGPIESSRLSSVVDCARLPWRREGRVLEGASLMPEPVDPVGEAGVSAAPPFDTSSFPNEEISDPSYLNAFSLRRLLPAVVVGLLPSAALAKL